MGTIVKLPQIPKDHNYEDFIAAHLNAEGYFLERGIHKREGEEILELDIVTNKFTSAGEIEKTFLEAKSGHKWGFPDIFKVKGWMVYLDFEKAYFVVLDSEDKNVEFYRRISNVLKIKLLSTPVVSNNIVDDELYKAFDIQKRKYNAILVPLFRFSYALERNMLSHLAQSITEHKGSAGLFKLKNLISKINDSSFFIRSPKKRVQAIFEAFQDSVRITAKIDHELQGDKFDEITDEITISTNTYRLLYYECKEKNVLYTSLYAELMEKIEILKCCVEEISRKGENSLFATFETTLLPSNLKTGMEKLKQCPHFYLYPYLMQVFCYVFGGFIIKEKQQEEYEILSEISNVPIDEIESALHSFDLLFPKADGSWMIEVPYSEIIQVEMMPTPFCGVGANLRRMLYCKSGKFEELKAIVSKYCYKDLEKWNNLLISYLETSNDLVKSKTTD